MKAYPSINSEVSYQPIYAFDKLDGSNIRAEWTKKQGFHKFGKRNHLLDDTNPLLREAEQLVIDGYAETLTQVFRDRRWDKAVCFFEFFGPNSFAGKHEEEPHEILLIDVAGPRGILEPQTFIEFTKGLKTAPVLYQGTPDDEFLDKVRTGSLEGMTFEGVVCKGAWVSPGRPLMFKVKNQAWHARLRSTYAGDEKMIQQLM